MNKRQNGFSAIEGLLILVIVGILGFTGWYVWRSKNTTDKTLNAASNTSQSSTTTPTSSTASWKTYGDGTISFRYPQSVKVAKTTCPPAAGSCVSVKATSDSSQGLIFYEKASTLSAKDFATQNYSSDGITVTTSNSSPINGFDAYTAKTSQTLSGTTYIFWETYISNKKEVAYSNYPSTSAYASTYKQVVETLKLTN